jgi:hypothetical protein
MNRSFRRHALAVFAPFLLLPVASWSCGKTPVSRGAYVDLWALASLRAREKGTEPREELDAILSLKGIRKGDFEDAQVRWFDEAAAEEIRAAIRRMLEPSRLLPRAEYARFRAVAELRAEIRGSAFPEEISAMGRARGFPPEAYRAARDLWESDEDTEREIERIQSSLAGARRVPWAAWKEITADPGYAGSQGKEFLAGELRRRSLAIDDWMAMEELFGE